MSSGLHSAWQMTAGRCHTLLSPVTEESGEEGTNSEISSPPACRSPSPVANTEASVNQVPPTCPSHTVSSWWMHFSVCHPHLSVANESPASLNLSPGAISLSGIVSHINYGCHRR